MTNFTSKYSGGGGSSSAGARASSTFSGNTGGGGSGADNLAETWIVSEYCSEVGWPVGWGGWGGWCSSPGFAVLFAMVCVWLCRYAARPLAISSGWEGVAATTAAAVCRLLWLRVWEVARSTA